MIEEPNIQYIFEKQGLKDIKKGRSRMDMVADMELRLLNIECWNLWTPLLLCQILYRDLVSNK